MEPIPAMMADASKKRGYPPGMGEAMAEDQAASTRELLKSHWLLSHLGDGAFDRLVGFVRREKFAANQAIFSRGDPGQSLLAVAKGRVKISNEGLDGRAVVFDYIDTGEVFGEIALLDGEGRSADATAVGDTELLVLKRRDLLPLLEREPKLCLQLLAVLCGRLRRTTEQVEDLLFLVRPARLAKVLIRLADEYGTQVEGGISIDLELSRRELGNLTGMTRESMNRQLTEWRREGLVDVAGGHVIIQRMEALERLVSDA